ncbi:MAG TPA: hypothetical protein VMU08_11120 [Rhizomicrobium sp.]|nr:hypothetical protein [Rhizomicrobium sp.]
MTDATLRTASPRAPFEPDHAWDRNFFLLMIVLIWIGIANGFGFEIVRHIQKHEAAYPLIVHVHAVAFVGWLVVLTTQILLIRTHRIAVHMALGKAAMGLAAIMVVLGPATAIYMQRVHVGTPASDPAFLAIQLSDILAFAVLIAAAFAWRRTPSAHKRLILIATLYITDAGFARWLGDGIHGLFGDGYWSFVASAYLGNDVLLLGMGVYDLATRRRLHPAWLAGAGWTFAVQLSAGYLYLAPWWKPIASHLIGH